LLRFYGTHRALVRGKVACLGRANARAERRSELTWKAADYLNVATASALAVRPALFVMTGLSGAGKSTVARAIARALDINLIATDEVRKELAGERELAVTVWREGLYAPERTDATYAAMLSRADLLLAAGRPALLDGTFLDTRWREQAVQLATARAMPCVLVETVCDDAVVRRRLAARQAAAQSPSDATVETYERQRDAVMTTPPALPRGTLHVAIDTTPEGPVALAPLLRALEREVLLTAEIPATIWPSRAPLART
jgi:predicted kinase